MGIGGPSRETQSRMLSASHSLEGLNGGIQQKPLTHFFLLLLPGARSDADFPTSVHEAVIISGQYFTPGSQCLVICHTEPTRCPRLCRPNPGFPGVDILTRVLVIKV